MLRRPAERILLNDPQASDVIVDTTNHIAHIKGIAFPLTVVDNELTDCIKKYCASDCTEKVLNVTVALPVSSCGCIEEWAIKIKKKSRGLYDLKDIRPIERIYTYDTPANAVPTDTEIKDFIVAAINADKSNGVVALSTGANTFSITGEDCTDFDAFLVLGMGSIAVGTAFVPAVLTADDMARLFPNKPGFWGTVPNLPTCGTYCKYILKLRGTKQDLGDSQGYITFEQDVELYVNNLAGAGFAAFELALEPISVGGSFCV